MHISRDNRGNLRFVNKPKDRGSHGGSKHPRPTFDRPNWPQIPLPPRGGFFEPPRHPPTRDPPRDIRPPARPPARPPRPANTAHRDRPPRFDEKRGIRRHSRDLYEETGQDVSLDTGTAYPCTQQDLDASGGIHRLANYRQRSVAEMRTIWFSEPNTGPKVGMRQAALDVFRHNAPGRIPSVKEEDAIERLCVMIDNACQGDWGPDVAIKCFCDLDTVFFRGKLRGHVCVTWTSHRNFGAPDCWGETINLDHGKVLIILNAKFIFLGRGSWHETPLRQTLATLVHEMW